MTPQFTGIWPAVLTPVSEDGRVAVSVLEQLTDLFIEQRLGGLYLTGSTGQWPSFTVPERCEIVDTVTKTAAGRIPIMVHVGATTTADSVTLARHAEKAGAHAISAVVPGYYSHSTDAVFEYYRAVGAATHLPFFVYHLSGVSKLAIGSEQYTSRLLAIPNIAGMKITDRDLYTFGLIKAFTRERLQLLSGADEVMCQAILSGAQGAIGTFYNLWGPVCQRAREICVEGDISAAQEFMLCFQNAIASVLTSGSLWTFIRSAMRVKYGIDVGMPRPPLGTMEKPWRDDDIRQIITQVDATISP